MTKLLVIAACLLAVNIYPSNKFKVKDDQCYLCHKDLGDDPSMLFADDVHRSAGLSCSSCHGGNSSSDDMDAAMDKKSGFLGVPKGDEITERCVKCHADKKMMKSLGADIPTNQFELLKSSVHGRLATNGRERIVQCITCHNAHGIQKVTSRKSPVYPLNVPKLCAKCHSNAVFMRSYNPGLPVDQYQKYRTSVHGMKNAKGDPKTAECVSCHGSHGIMPVKDVRSKVYATNIPGTCAKCHADAEYMKEYKIPTDQYEKYTEGVHGVALLQKNDLGAPACNSCHGNHAATPPGVSSISEVCGTCHALNAELFSASPHKKAFDKKNYPECETCHSNHDIVTATDKLLGVSKGAVCIKCHTKAKDDKGYRVALQMKSLIDSLDSAALTASALVDEAEQKGMEISEAKYQLRDAHQAKLQARTMVHSFNLDKFENVVNKKGLKVTNEVIAEAHTQIGEYYFRRIGLAVSVLFISLLCVGLFLYIRKLENNK